MKYYSEQTRQFYDSVDECEKAENELVELKKKAELEAKAKSEAREKRAKEVEEAIHAAQDAQKKMYDLLHKFNEDYGPFHYSYKGDNDNSFLSLFDFFNWL